MGDRLIDDWYFTVRGDGGPYVLNTCGLKLTEKHTAHPCSCRTETSRTKKSATYRNSIKTI